LIELLSRLSHSSAVLGSFHPLLELVHIFKSLDLLLSEASKLAENLLPLLLGPGLSKRRLSLSELFTQLILPSRQVAEAIENCNVLMLVLLLPCQSFRFVSIFPLCKL
jgi:hypothetical protein